MSGDPEKAEADPLVTKEEKDDPDRNATVHDDIVDTIKLGVPIFVAMLSWVGVSTRTFCGVWHGLRVGLFS